MKTNAQFLQAQVDLAQSKRSLRVSQQSLRQALGLDDFAVLIATGSLATTSPSQPPNSVDSITNNHPAVELKTAALTQARAALSSSESALAPALSASYTRSLQGTSLFPSHPSWSWQGLLSLPIFGNGLTSTGFNIAAAKRNVEKAEEDLRSAHHQVQTDLETTWSGLAQAQDQVRVQLAFLEAARQRKAEADVRYQSGLMSFENWEPIVIELANFERSSLKSQSDAVKAEAEWIKSLGKGLDERP